MLTQAILPPHRHKTMWKNWTSANNISAKHFWSSFQQSAITAVDFFTTLLTGNRNDFLMVHPTVPLFILTELSWFWFSFCIFLFKGERNIPLKVSSLDLIEYLDFKEIVKVLIQSVFKDLILWHPANNLLPLIKTKRPPSFAFHRMRPQMLLPGCEVRTYQVEESEKAVLRWKAQETLKPLQTEKSITKTQNHKKTIKTISLWFTSNNSRCNNRIRN